MSGRLPHLMRDYPAFKPSEIGDYTVAEIAALLTDQNDRWKAIEAAQRAQQQQKRRR